MLPGRSGIILAKWDYLLGSYVLATISVARLFHNSAMIGALLASLDLFFVPYLFGVSVISLLWRLNPSMSYSMRFLIGLFTGTILLDSGLNLMEYFFIRISIPALSILITSLVVATFLLDLWFRRNVPNQVLGLRVLWRRLGPAVYLFASGAMGATAFAVTKLKLPFSLVSQDGGVGYEAIRPVTRLLQFGILDSVKVRTLPVILQAIVSSLSSIDIQSLSWAAPLSTSIVFSVSMFCLIRKIWGNSNAALIASLFGTFVNGSGIFFDTVYFIFRYSTIATSIFPLVIGESFSLWNGLDPINRRFRTFLPLLTGALILIGFLYVFEFLRPASLVSLFTVNSFLKSFLIPPFLALSIVWVSTRNRDSTWTLLGILLSSFVAYGLTLDILRPAVQVLVPFFMLWVASALTRQITAISGQNLTFGTVIPPFNQLRFFLTSLNWGSLIRITGILLALTVTLSLAGAVNLSYISPINSWKVDTAYVSQSLELSDSLALLALSLVISLVMLFSADEKKAIFAVSYLASLVLLFLPVAESSYFGHNLTNIFLGAVVALGLVSLFRMIGHLGTPKINGAAKFGACFALVLILFAPVASTVLVRYTWTPEGGQYSSLTTSYENAMMNQYISKLPADTRIVSDPFTMTYLASLTNRIELVDTGMAPLTSSYASLTTVYSVWNHVFHANSSSEIFSALSSFNGLIPHDEKRFVSQLGRPLNLSSFIIVVTSRTAFWLNQGDPLGWWDIFPENTNVTTSTIMPFVLAPQYFHLTFQIPQKVYIFSFSENQQMNTSPSGLLFDGLTGYISVPNSETLQTTVFTVQVVFKPDLSHKGMLFARGSATTDNSWFIYSENWQEILLVVYDSTGIRHNYQMTYHFKPGGWYGVDFVIPSAGNVTGYVNGIRFPDLGARPNFSANNSPLVIGTEKDAKSYFYAGVISSILLYNRSLLDSEIQSNMIRFTNPSQSGLVLWLPLREGAGTIVSDYSTLQNNGYLHGNVSWAVF